MNAINSHPNVTHWASGNKFSHLDHKTFSSLYLMASNFSAKVYNTKSTIHKSTGPKTAGGRHLLAADVDWRTAGYVPPIRNQAQCGTF